jgi:hypothetical protein
MDNKITSKNFNIIPLASSYVASYLQQFSETVREALRVTSIDAEHEYLQAALEKQAKGETHFYLIVAESHQVIGAVEIRKPEQSRGQLYTWLN